MVLVGAGALVFMLWEPLVEGRNARATLFETYFQDPFLAYAYASSVPFFMMLYQAWQLAGCPGPKGVSALGAIRAVRYCAISLIVLVAVPVVYLMIARPGDDIAGGIAMGIMMIVIFGSVVALAAVHEGRIKRLNS